MAIAFPFFVRPHRSKAILSSYQLLSFIKAKHNFIQLPFSSIILFNRPILGRFPLNQIFRFEIPGILCDEWNSN